ncbi:Uncharacterised protein [Mycobacteroides abscessus subsp. abscessus]|nr:Uncharacterised protein [Mycobacteroides abscessus subsp. abscessus]
MVTKTEIGTPGARDSMMPPMAAISAKTIDSAMARAGDDVMRAAAAAGVMSSDITSRAPTICTPCAAVRPTSAAKTIPNARTGTPRASATSGSTVANSIGR